MFPMLFKDDEEYDDEPKITEEEVADLQAEMAAMNAELRNK